MFEFKIYNTKKCLEIVFGKSFLLFLFVLFCDLGLFFLIFFFDGIAVTIFYFVLGLVLSSYYFGFKRVLKFDFQQLTFEYKKSLFNFEISNVLGMFSLNNSLKIYTSYAEVDSSTVPNVCLIIKDVDNKQLLNLLLTDCQFEKDLIVKELKKRGCEIEDDTKKSDFFY